MGQTLWRKAVLEKNEHFCTSVPVSRKIRNTHDILMYRLLQWWNSLKNRMFTGLKQSILKISANFIVIFPRTKQISFSQKLWNARCLHQIFATKAKCKQSPCAKHKTDHANFLDVSFSSHNNYCMVKYKKLCALEAILSPKRWNVLRKVSAYFQQHGSQRDASTSQTLSPWFCSL